MPKVGFRMPLLKHFPVLFYFLRQALSFQLIILTSPTGQQQPPELPLFAPGTDVLAQASILGFWAGPGHLSSGPRAFTASILPRASLHPHIVLWFELSLLHWFIYSAWGRQHAAMLTWGQNMTMWIMGQKLNPQSCPQVALPAEPSCKPFSHLGMSHWPGAH